MAAWSKRILLLFFVLLFLFILSFPTLFSIPYFRSFASKLFSLTGYSFSIEKAEMGWFGSQHLENLEILNANDHLVIQCKSLTLKEGLINLVLRGTFSSPLSIQELSVLLDVENSKLHLFSEKELKNACRVTINSLQLAQEDGTYKATGDAQIEYKEQKGDLVVEGFPIDRLEKLYDTTHYSLIAKNLPLQVVKPLAPRLIHPLLSLYVKDLLQLEVTKREENLVLHVDSSLIKSNLEAVIRNEVLFLNAPGSLILTFPQGKTAAFPIGKQEFSLSTTQSTDAFFVLKELVLPLRDSFDQAEFVIESKISEVAVSNQEMPLPIQAKNIALDGRLKNGEIDLLLGINANAGKKPVRATFQSKLPLPESYLNLLESLFSESDFQFTTTRFPLEILESFDHFASTSYLGEYLDLSFTYSSETRQGTFSAKSDAFSLEKTSFSFQNEQLTFHHPVHFQAVFPQYKSAYFSLEEPATLAGVIEKLDIPIKEPKNTSLHAHFATTKAHISSPFLDEKPLVGIIQGKMETENLGEIATSLNFIPEQSSSQKPLFAVNGMFLMKKYLEGSTFYVEAKTDSFRGKGEFKVGANGLLYLRTPSTIDYYPTVAASEAIGIAPFLLPPKMRLKLQHCELPLLSEKAIIVKGDLILGNFSTGVKGSEIFLEDVLIPFRIHGNVIDFKATGSTEKRKIRENFLFDASLQYDKNAGLPFFPMKTAEFSLRNIPPELLTFFIPVNEKMLRSPIDGNMFYEDLSTLNDGTLRVDLRTQNTQVKGKFIIEKEQIKIDDSFPFSLSLNLDDTAFKEIRSRVFGSQASIAMITPTSIQMSVTHFTIPKREDGTLLFHKGGYDLTLSAKPLHFFDKTINETIQFQEIRAHVYGKSIDKEMKANLSLIPKTPLKKGAHLTLAATLENGFNSNGELQLEKGKVVIEGSSNDLRSVAFCSLFCPYPAVAYKLDALIGEPLNAKFAMNVEKMEGFLRATAEGAHGKLDLDGRVDKGILYLQKPLIATVQVTNKLGSFVMAEIAPLFSGLYKAYSPLHLSIDPKGFAFPLFDYRLEDVRIGLGQFDAGRLVFQQSNELLALLGVLGSSSSREVAVWLTPAFFSLQNGWVELRRMDALIDNRYHVALWGKVNLLTDEIDMTVGLTKHALERAFKVAGIKEGSMLQIPLRGTTKKPKLDRAEAAAKIAALLASSQVPNGIIGSIVDVAANIVINPSPPPPTVFPFPWSTEEEKKKPSNEKKLIESIEKETKKLLRKIFP